MVQVHDQIDEYLTRLQELAHARSHVDRFYLFMGDDRLADLEYELANSDRADAFYNRLLDLYRAWKAEMSPAQWAEVVAHNDALNGANQNALIDELA